MKEIREKIESDLSREKDEDFSEKEAEAINGRELELERESSRQKDEEQLSNIREKIQEDTKEKIPEEDSYVQSADETIQSKGREFYVRYASAKEMGPYFGYADGDWAVVREDLPARIKKFVRAHELYHCADTKKWGGDLGREIRANLYPGLKDPIGLAATIFATLKDKERIKLYLDRIRKKR
jgi:hypothetical protein